MDLYTGSGGLIKKCQSLFLSSSSAFSRRGKKTGYRSIISSVSWLPKKIAMRIETSYRSHLEFPCVPTHVHRGVCSPKRTQMKNRQQCSERIVDTYTRKRLASHRARLPDCKTKLRPAKRYMQGAIVDREYSRAYIRVKSARCRNLVLFSPSIPYTRKLCINNFLLFPDALMQMRENQHVSIFCFLDTSIT